MANASSSPILFYGEYPHTLDPKNRITIPSRWRRDDPENVEVFVVVPHFRADCLLVMSNEEFHAVAAKIENSSKLSTEAANAFISKWYATARDCSIDKQGRLLLAEDHCRQKHLRGEVLLVGARHRIELWDKEAYARSRESKSSLVDQACPEANM